MLHYLHVCACTHTHTLRHACTYTLTLSMDSEWQFFLFCFSSFSLPIMCFLLVVFPSYKRFFFPTLWADKEAKGSSAEHHPSFMIYYCERSDALVYGSDSVCSELDHLAIFRTTTWSKAKILCQSRMWVRAVWLRTLRYHSREDVVRTEEQTCYDQRIINSSKFY